MVLQAEMVKMEKMVTLETLEMLDHLEIQSVLLVHLLAPDMMFYVEQLHEEICLTQNNYTVYVVGS